MVITTAVSKMEGNTTITIGQGVVDIDQLLKIWQNIKPEAQNNLKLVIDHKFSLLRECAIPDSSGDDRPRDPYSKYRLLSTFIRLADKLFEIDINLMLLMMPC